MILTLAQVHTILDLRTQSVLVGELCLYDNMKDTSYSTGNLPYVKQSVHFNSSNLVELGRPTRKKEEGTLVFEIHYRSGTGSAARNALLQKIKDGFSPGALGGVTLLSVQSLGDRGALNWVIDAHMIPFYFYSI
jgi:hypothetical protein